MEQKDFFNAISAKDGAQQIVAAWKSGEIETVFPGLFPDKPGRVAGALQEYLKAFDGLPEDRDMRIALLLLCFDTKNALEAAQNLEIEEASKEHITKTIQLRDEFHFVDSIPKLKTFIAMYSDDFFKFIHKISIEQERIHDHFGIRNEGRQEYYWRIKKSGDPLYIKDLAVDDTDLKNLGVADEKIESTLWALLKFVHAYPHQNEREILLQKAKNVNDMVVTRLIKKLFGKY